MIENGMDIARLNFSWGDLAEHAQQIKRVREAEKALGVSIIIIADLPGPRVQEGKNHTYDHSMASAMTDHDRECISFGVEQGVDCFALSFVGSAADVELCRASIREHSGRQTIIAKIERAVAIEHLDEIIAAADAVMVARGDLGLEVPLERMPFVQADIVSRANTAGKPVIIATGMLLSMVDSPLPARAEVTDIVDAILEGSDAIMLSDETAKGRYPAEAVKVMEGIALEAEAHISADSSHVPRTLHLLQKINHN
jgi:pyruvate kinase